MNTTFSPLFVFRFHKHFVSLQADSIALRPYHRSEESHEDNGHECGEDEESEPVAALDDFFCFLFFHYHLLFVVCDGAKVRAGCYKRVSKV